MSLPLAARIRDNAKTKHFHEELAVIVYRCRQQSPQGHHKSFDKLDYRLQPAAARCLELHVQTGGLVVPKNGDSRAPSTVFGCLLPILVLRH